MDKPTSVQVAKPISLTPFEELTKNLRTSADWLKVIATLQFETAKKQTEIIKLLQAQVKPEPPVLGRPEYSILELDLTDARADVNLGISGTYISATTTGDPSNIYFRFESPSNDAVYLGKFNGLYLPFTTLYVSNTAQTGKKLTLFIGFRQSSAGVMPIVDSSSRLFTISTDPVAHFSGALAQYAKEDENITGVVANKIKITGISIQSVQALDYYLMFWSKDTFNSTTMAADTFVGLIELDFTTWGQQVGAANQYYFSVEGLDFDYEDRDNSKEIHCSLYNASPVSKSAGSSGYVKADITYEVRE